MKANLFSRSKGFSLVEILVASAIIVLVGVSAVTAWRQYLVLMNENTKKAQAALLTEEAGEALELFKDKSWNDNISNLSTGIPYYIYWNGSQYGTSTTPVLVQDAYVVRTVFDAVNRDASDNIAETGTDDPNTRKVTITVSMADESQPILQSQMLLHDVYKN